jgi:hypothetical protein
MMNPIEVEQPLLLACLGWALAGVNFLKNFVLLTGLGGKPRETTGSTVVLLPEYRFKDALEPLCHNHRHWATFDQTRDRQVAQAHMPRMKPTKRKKESASIMQD